MRQNRNNQNGFSKPAGPHKSNRPVSSGSERKPKPETGGNAKARLTPASRPPGQTPPAPQQTGPKKFGTKTFEGKTFESKTFESKTFKGKKFAPKKVSERISAAELSSLKAGADLPTDVAKKATAGRAETKLHAPPNSRPQPFKRAGGGTRRTGTAAPSEPRTRGERVAKIIARAGHCSRRDAEAWIAEGRVAVNGKVLTSPAIALGPSDQISIDGVPLAARQRTRLFLFHKPRGLVTTNKDPEGRATIFDHLHQHAPDAPRLMSIGRLDINTEGLLLLTNDGGLARILELPSTGWLRRYRVRANGETDQTILDGLAKGVTIDGLRYAGIEAVLDRQQGANCWLTLGLREGKNREIKRVLEHLGLAVNRLIRISFGPFQLGEIAEGKIEEVRTRVLRDQLGTALAQAAGVDFDAARDIPAPPETAADKTNAFARKIPRTRAAAGATKPRHDAKPRRDTKSRRDTKANPKSNAEHGKASRFGTTSRSAPKAAPEPEKPRSRPQPGPRKHISALRAEGKGPSAEDPRQRIERDEIADRKGRAVTIERRSRSKDMTTETARKKPAQRQDRPEQQRPGRAPGPAAPRTDAPRPSAGGKGRRLK